jgi:uncharacterized protein with GYD domain
MQAPAAIHFSLAADIEYPIERAGNGPTNPLSKAKRHQTKSLTTGARHPMQIRSCLLSAEVRMAKYLVRANYVGNGVAGLIKDGGSKRRAVVEKLFGSVGGRVEAFYFAFGGTDLFVIGDLPDNASAAALSLAVNASGAATTNITVLMTAEEMDAAAKKTPDYRAPGR